MLDYCAEHGIVSDIELTSIDKLAEAYERVVKGDVKYRFVIDMATLPKARRRLREERDQGRVEGDGLGGTGEPAGSQVAVEDGDRGRVLIAAENPLGGGVKGEVAGRLAPAGNALEQGETAIALADREDDERVFAAVAGIEEVAVGRDGDFCGCIFLRWKVRRDGLDGSIGVDEEALGGVVSVGLGPEVVVDGGVDLVDAVDPAAVGMEDEVAWAGTGAVVGEGMACWW